MHVVCMCILMCLECLEILGQSVLLACCLRQLLLQPRYDLFRSCLVVTMRCVLGCLV
jgi:hypothetical protein